MKLYPCLILLCVVLALSAGLTSFFGPILIDFKLSQGIKDFIIWRPNSPPEVYERYSRDNHPGDPPVYARFWFFNITNLKEVQQGAKPELNEVGPYTYLKHRQKVDVWFDHKGMVRFKEYEYMVPAATQSTGNAATDTIITANIPLLGALAKARSMNVETVMAATIRTAVHDRHNDGIFLKRTPQELLFGYEDPLFAIVHRFVSSFEANFSLIANITSMDNAKQLPVNVVDTGANNVSNLWQQRVWNGYSDVSCWNNHTEVVRGSDAFQFRPGLNENSTIEAWVGQLFRAARLLPNRWASLHGVKLLRFKPDPEQFEPDPRYFQYVRGLPNVSEPTNSGPDGLPGSAAGPLLYMAFPHYCQADPLLSANVSGLKCVPQKHEIFVDVEPTTGVTMRAAKRLMLVVQYGVGGKQSLQPRVAPNTFLPVFWAEEYSEASADKARTFSDKVYGAQLLSKRLRELGFLAAIVFALAATLLIVMACFDSGVHRHHHRRSGDGGGGGSRRSSLQHSRPGAGASAKVTTQPNGVSQPNGRGSYDKSGGASGSGQAVGVVPEGAEGLNEPLLADDAGDGDQSPGA